MNDKRLSYVDMAKGIGVILMIMGHIKMGDMFYHYIHAFHMPMFFILSGYVYKKHKLTKELLKKRIQQLLVPYVIIGIFHYLFWLLLNYKRVDDVLVPLKSIFWMNTSLDMPICGAIWFLTAFFVSSILFSVIMNYCVEYAGVLTIGIAVISSIVTSITTFRLPWAFDAGLVGIGFMYIGYIWKNVEWNENIQKFIAPSIIKNLIVGAIVLALIYFNGTVNMRTGEYSIIPLTWFNSIVATIVITNLCYFFEMRCSNKLNKKLLDGISYIGKNSIIYLCFNQIVIYMLNKISSILIKTELVGSNLAIKRIVYIVASLLMLSIMNEIIMRTKLKYIFGK